MISILFLTADPTNASRLRLGEEAREIQEKLQLAKLRDEFTLHQRMSVRPADISQALLDVNPQIVQFSGHGTSTGALCVENKVREIHPIQPDTLAALFEQFTSTANCVVLNACYSRVQAEAIAKHIQYVIGMNQAIGDEAAIAFSVGFYQALGAGRSIEEAYKLGCVQIRLQNIPEHLTPVLIKKSSAAPTFAHKLYQLPENYNIYSMRKNRTVSSDELDRQRIGLSLFAGRHTWSFIALIESVGNVDYAIQATSAAGQMTRVFTDELMSKDVAIQNFNPKLFTEMCVKFADLGIKNILHKLHIPDGVFCGTKMAIAIRFNQEVFVSCIGECGALLRWEVGGEDYYRNVSNRSLITIAEPNAITLGAPIGHILFDDESENTSAALPIEREFSIEPARFPLNGDTAFAVLTSHKIYRNNQHSQQMIRKISSQTTMHGITQYLCEVEGVNYEECMAVGLYFGNAM